MNAEINRNVVTDSSSQKYTGSILFVARAILCSVDCIEVSYIRCTCVFQVAYKVLCMHVSPHVASLCAWLSMFQCPCVGSAQSRQQFLDVQCYK